MCVAVTVYTPPVALRLTVTMPSPLPPDSYHMPPPPLPNSYHGHAGLEDEYGLQGAIVIHDSVKESHG